MNVLRQRKYLFALLVLLVVFAGCKGEDPTAPPVGGTPTGGIGGGTTPPTGATITLTAANPTPLAGSSTTLTATVTVNGNPAPNGTAVEFSTTAPALFEDSGAQTTIRTTTNGVATASITSASAGTFVVTAVVNNSSKTVTVTFQTRPTTPTTPDAAPVITAVAPNQGRPEGGETVTITGRNFRGPVRVFFDFGNGITKEALVTSVTSTQIQVLTPATDLGAGQTQNATIVVFTEQGTAAETRLSATFVFRRAVLTPRITTVSPDSGPINGGTRITIFGDGFEAPVQVSFSTNGTDFSAMQVLNVTFNQIIAITPTARDVNPDGSGPLTGPVTLRVLNINSATQVQLVAAFRYTSKMQITGVSPSQGTALGGTRVQIDGVGFEDPVQVQLAGVPATVVSASGTRVIVVSSALLSPCAGTTGAVAVTNIENGDFDIFGIQPNEPSYIYIPVNPVITGVSSAGPIMPGSTVVISVLNPGIGAIRIGAGSTTIIPTPSVSTTGLGVQTFSIVLPTSGFTFPTQTCNLAGGLTGSQLGNLTLPVTFTNVTTTCTDTLTGGLTIQPPAPNTCLTPPMASVAPSGVSPFCATPPAPIVAAGAATGTATITISNAATASPLIVSGAAVSGATNGTITVNPAVPPNVIIPAGGSSTFNVVIDPTAAGPVTGTVTFTTNDPQRGSIPVCVTATGT